MNTSLFKLQGKPLYSTSKFPYRRVFDDVSVVGCITYDEFDKQIDKHKVIGVIVTDYTSLGELSLSKAELKSIKQFNSREEAIIWCDLNNLNIMKRKDLYDKYSEWCCRFNVEHDKFGILKMMMNCTYGTLSLKYPNLK